MPASTARANVNQVIQIGPETTPGTTVAATKVIEATSIEPGVKANFKVLRSQGRKYPSLSAIGREWMEAKMTGEASYNELAYWLCSAAQSVTPTTHTGGTISKDWTFTPLLTGNTSVQTFTVEKGDTATRAYKFGYGLVTGIGLDFSRDDVTFNGTMIGQRLTDAITMTPALSPIGIQPILAAHTNIYLDTTSSGIGGTLLADGFTASFIFDAAYGTYWAINRAQNSFTKTVDLAPKAEFKIKMEADSVGMSPLTGARVGSAYYIRVNCQGPIIEGAIPYALTIDLAAQVSAIATFGDFEGIYAIEWTFTITDDISLGKAWSAILTNAIATL